MTNITMKKVIEESLKRRKVPTAPVDSPPVPFVFAIFSDIGKLIKLCGTVEVLNEFIVREFWYITAEVGSRHVYHLAGGRTIGYIECWTIDI